MQHSIDLRISTVGPRYDPYSREKLTVKCGDKSAELTCCGLTGTHLTLATGKYVEREFHCCEFYPASKAQFYSDRLKARLLFKRWVGIYPEDARDEFERVCGFDICPEGHYDGP